VDNDRRREAFRVCFTADVEADASEVGGGGGEEGGGGGGGGGGVGVEAGGEPVATYPSAGGRRETRGMRVPRTEYARSRHQRLFEENVGKTGRDAIYELLS